MAQCASLISSIKSKLHSWTVRFLSFAGRLQLISTVISGITNFWQSSFILPKGCVTEIESLCSRFLWKGNTNNQAGAKVAWDTLTFSKDEGGLGLKNLAIWNTASALKLIWMLFFQPGSIWRNWYITEVLEGNLNNFWVINTKQKNSWLANEMLHLRDMAYLWIRMKVRNGEHCYFWSSNWSPYGNIRVLLEAEGSTNIGIPKETTIAELWDNGGWVLPPWYKEVWFSGGVPKHKTFTWLTTLNRNPTRDRLANWGLQTDTNCLLCFHGLESRNHLYFECSFSWSIWVSMARRCGFQGKQNWDQNLQELHSCNSPRPMKKLLLIAWQERNNRLHRHISKSTNSICKEIDRLVRNRISSLRSSNPEVSSTMIQLWFSTQ